MSELDKMTKGELRDQVDQLACAKEVAESILARTERLKECYMGLAAAYKEVLICEDELKDELARHETRIVRADGKLIERVTFKWVRDDGRS